MRAMLSAVQFFPQDIVAGSPTAKNTKKVKALSRTRVTTAPNVRRNRKGSMAIRCSQDGGGSGCEG